MTKGKMVRKNVYCSERNANNIKKYSEEMSISESAFVNFCISEYAKQQQALEVMGGMNELLREVKNLQATLESQNATGKE